MKNLALLILLVTALYQGLWAQSPQTATGTVPLSEIHIRDPYILPVAEDSAYYMFGTNEADKLYRSRGFYCYKSKDMKNWTGPYPAFIPSDSFWGENNFWAAECHAYRGKYYLFATSRCKADSLLGTGTFVSDRPEGPYRELSRGPITPHGWNSLDGTLYVDRRGAPWMIFCHEWTQIGDGTVEAVRLKKDLSAPASKPVTLFRASEAPWVRSHVPGQKLFVTDGPFLLRDSRDGLLMLWSSFSDEGYSIGVARSESGDIDGPWRQFSEPLFGRDGGHGMIVRTFGGPMLLSIHQPNRTPDERTQLFPVRETADGGLELATKQSGTN